MKESNDNYDNCSPFSEKTSGNLLLTTSLFLYLEKTIQI